MKASHFAAVGLVCLATLGCRTDPAIEFLERQNRLLEDEIYRLRDCIADYESGVPSYPTDSLLPEPSAPADAPLPESPAYDGGRLDPPPLGVPEPPPQIVQPASPRPAGADPDTPAILAPPKLNPGRPLQEGELPGILDKYRSPATSGPSDEEEKEGGSDGRADAQPTAAGGPLLRADSSHVTQLALNRLLTGGYNADGRPGDEGIVVVIEPRDAQGRWVEAPAAVSVVVLDPALEGEAARVARWEFTEEQTGAMLLRAGLGRGIGLEMDWPDGPPKHDDLHVFVRYVTSDGRNLQADNRIRIELPQDRTAGWIPRPKQARRQQAEPLARRQPHQPIPAARPPAPLSPRTAAAPPRPSETRTQRPVWSPDRR